MKIHEILKPLFLKTKKYSICPNCDGEKTIVLNTWDMPKIKCLQCNYFGLIKK